MTRFKRFANAFLMALLTLALVAFVLPALGGCSRLQRAETIEVREGLAEVNKPIHKWYLRWAEDLHRQGLLSDAGLDSCRKLVAKHDAIIETSRKRDSLVAPPSTQPSTPSLPLPAPPK